MKRYFLLIIIFLFLAPPVFGKEDGLKMTLTPPIIKNNMNPGESWMSTVKLVNNNKEELNVYTDLRDFRSSPDGGVDLISPEESSGDGSHVGFLKQWMKIQPGPYHISPFSSIEIPFEIRVPEDAEPGGHYAAILVGTKPNNNLKGTGISISSMISSLVLVTISGDVIEEGKIREFSTDKTYYNEPNVNLKLKFENTGNVHLQPKGSIIIKDMFGKEKGSIDINKDTAYGNVLPGSTKTWDFNWQGELGILKMGKYSATINVYYGEKTTEVDTRTFYFWYVDFKLVGIILGSILAFILFISLMIKIYIRKAIRQSQKEIEKIKAQQADINPMSVGGQNYSSAHKNTKKEQSIIEQNAPHTEKKHSVVDLKELMKNKK